MFGMTKIVTLNEVKGGCQGFIGPYPSAFLDKHPYVIFKNWRKDNGENLTMITGNKNLC